MADIAARSLALVDGYGAGYRPTGTPISPRFTVAKSIKDNGNGTGTITLTVTVKTNAGYIGGGYILTLNFSCAGVSTSKVWKASATNWAASSTYTTTIAVTISLDGTTSKSADLWLTNNSGSAFTFRSSSQDGDSITGIPLGYQTATFTAFSGFSSTASSIAVTVREKTASLKNRMTLKIGTTTIRFWDDLDNVDSLPLISANHAAIHNAVPNATSAVATMIMETMNGTTVVGTVTRTATVTIASTVVPTLTSITAAETASAVTSLVGAGNYIQSISRAKFDLVGTAAGQGATIAKREIIFDGVTYSGTTATTGAINKSGSLTATGRVTDSRGRVISRTVTISFLPYQPPKLSGVSVNRASTTGGTINPLGQYLRVDRVASVSPLTVGGVQKNSLVLRIQHRATGTTTWVTAYSNTWTTVTSISGATVPTSTYDLLKSYDVSITVSDYFGSAASLGQIGTAQYPLVIGANSVGIGKIPEAGRMLDVAEDAYVGGKLIVSGATTLQGGYSPIAIPASANLNNYQTPGWYYVNVSATAATIANTPLDIAFSMTVERNAGVTQTFNSYHPTQPRRFFRSFYNSTWGPWLEFYTAYSAQILTSGTAMCVREPNGIQTITWNRTVSTALTQASGSNYFSATPLAQAAWPWPFIARPTCPQPTVTGGGQLVWASVSEPASATMSPNCYVYRGTANSNSVAYTVEFLARGRWK